MHKKIRRISLAAGIILILFMMVRFDEGTVMTVESTWMQYENPEDAGWSRKKLTDAKSYYDRLNSTAAMLIHDGKVVVAWGDVAANTSAHSVRKSFLNALYGIAVEKNQIQLGTTLNELHFDQYARISPEEGEARISDLLRSRSGVYLQAGQESFSMRWQRPDRGAYEPDTHFYYNNWDFNALGLIYNLQTESDIFLDFKAYIADPLGMEDFTLEGTKYVYETHAAMIPSYLFRVSARDMARFGQLYLQKGQWRSRQIVPEGWIDQSRSNYTPSSSSSIYGYGYLWWVADKGYFAEKNLYSAIGRYGQSIDILPDDNIVFVHRVNSDSWLNRHFRNVSTTQRLKLLRKIIEAKELEPVDEPRLIQGLRVMR